MSRPPDQHTRYIESQYACAPDMIDFVPPRCLAAQSDLVYAQAGFPGYAGLASPYAQPPCQQPYVAQSYPPPMVGLQAPYAGPAAGQPLASSGPNMAVVPYNPPGYPSVGPGVAGVAPLTPGVTVNSQPPPSLTTEAEVQERIHKSINAIMEAQKTQMLSAKLETLTNKVQSLAHSLEHCEGARTRLSASEDDSAAHIRSLADKVDRLTRSIDQRPVESLSSTADSEIQRRLRRIAAENSSRSSKPADRIPDW